MSMDVQKEKKLQHYCGTIVSPRIEDYVGDEDTGGCDVVYRCPTCPGAAPAKRSVAWATNPNGPRRR